MSDAELRAELKALAQRRGLAVDEAMLDGMVRAAAHVARFRERLPGDLDPAETPAHAPSLPWRP